MQNPCSCTTLHTRVAPHCYHNRILMNVEMSLKSSRYLIWENVLCQKKPTSPRLEREIGVEQREGSNGSPTVDELLKTVSLLCSSRLTM
jgi:hypothetical protein